MLLRHSNADPDRIVVTTRYDVGRFFLNLNFWGEAEGESQKFFKELEMTEKLSLD